MRLTPLSRRRDNFSLVALSGLASMVNSAALSARFSRADKSLSSNFTSRTVGVPPPIYIVSNLPGAEFNCPQITSIQEDARRSL